MVRGLGLAVAVTALAVGAAQAAGVRVERTPDGIPYVVGDPSYRPPAGDETPSERAPDEAPFRPVLSERIEQAFVAEFEDKDGARQAWRSVALPAFTAVGDRIYPRPDPDAFAAAAVAELKTQRAANPSLTAEALAKAAMNPRKEGIVVYSFDDLANKPAPAPAKETVSLRMIKGVPVLRIVGFDEQTHRKVAETALPDSGRLIIDLRGNEGGLLDAVRSVAGNFVPPKAVVFVLDEAERSHPYRAHNEAAAGPFEIIVLIDRETNAGALMLAAALADQTQARVAGAVADKPSGRVFALMPMSGTTVNGVSAARTAIRYPSGYLKRATGVPLSAGVTVDVPIAATGDAAIEAAVKAFAKGKP